MRAWEGCTLHDARCTVRRAPRTHLQLGLADLAALGAELEREHRHGEALRREGLGRGHLHTPMCMLRAQCTRTGRLDARARAHTPTCPHAHVPTCPRPRPRPASRRPPRTPISGPACRYTPASVSRAIDEPTVLHTPRQRQPDALAMCSAASVSAVSPDCEGGRARACDARQSTCTPTTCTTRGHAEVVLGCLRVRTCESAMSTSSLCRMGRR